MAFQHYERAALTRLLEQVPGAVKSAALLAQPGLPAQDADELATVYLPLAALIQRRFSAWQALRAETSAALGAPAVPAPFIIGLAGSVAVGKSTTARLLQRALSAWPEHPDVALVTTDGFLFPNAVLEQRSLMERKGFPESFDTGQLVDFLRRLKTGETGIAAPVYSHDIYDVLPDQGILLQAPQIVIMEGVNTLLPSLPERDGDHLLASDFYDFSIYLHAEEELIREWYTQRFLALIETAVNNNKSFYSRFVPLSPEQRLEVVNFVWTAINGRNLNDHILPSRPRADLILHKGNDHQITHFETRIR